MENYNDQFNPVDATEQTTNLSKEHAQDAHDLNLRQRLIRRIGAPLAGVATLLAPTMAELATATPAHADSSLEYTVTNTEGGVYSRNSPHTSDTPKIVGQGAYDGDTVRLICGVTNGDAVGPYDNNSWHKVVNLSRPDQGEFWLNDRYVASPNNADQLAPGEPTCTNTTGHSSTEPNPTQYVGGCKTDFMSAFFTSSIKSFAGNGEDQWASAWDNSSHDKICVGASFDTPDTTNHRQFIGKVAAKSPYLLPSGCDDAFLLEVWDEGFYKKTNCTGGTDWEINQWLPDGSAVCAALSSAYHSKGFMHIEDANRAARNGEVPMGEDDPARELACIEIKA